MLLSNLNISAIGNPTLELYFQTIVVGELIELRHLKQNNVCFYIHVTAAYDVVY